MRVALVTRWGSLDGDVEYARNLIEYVSAANPDIEFSVFPAPFNPAVLEKSVKDFDVVHFNFVYGFALGAPGSIAKFGKKRVVLTFHENNPKDTRRTHSWLNECGQVIVHEKNKNGFVFIPHGVPVVSPCLWSEKNATIGTAGFPFPAKRVPVIAEAAALLREKTSRITGCRIAACDSGNANTWMVREQVLRFCPDAVYITEWLSQSEMLKVISANLVNVFIPNNWRLGPSGSVRLGLATGSHIVLSRSLMCRDLFEYEDEIEFVEGDPNQITATKVVDAVLRVLENGKRPKRVLEDQSWEKAAELYAQCYRAAV